MCKPNVPRETKQIETKDYLVSNEHFILKEFEKGLLKTTPNISAVSYTHLTLPTKA